MDNVNTDEPMVIVPIPSLIAILVHAENQKGSALNENEVNQFAEECVCMTMPFSMAYEMEVNRGYRDIRPEFAWQDWLEYKSNPDCLNL